MDASSSFEQECYSGMMAARKLLFLCSYHSSHNSICTFSFLKSYQYLLVCCNSGFFELRDPCSCDIAEDPSLSFGNGKIPISVLGFKRKKKNTCEQNVVTWCIGKAVVENKFISKKVEWN